jgi:hypothetical protein
VICKTHNKEFKNNISFNNHMRWDKGLVTSENLKGLNKGEKSGRWKGDKVKYRGLHMWVNKQLVKPKLCSNCFQEKRLELANISQKYKRNLADWEWLCRTCHMTKDGRLENLHKILAERRLNHAL